MFEKKYKIIELEGTSTKSRDDAASRAVDKAGDTIRGLKNAELVDLEMRVDEKKVEDASFESAISYRARVRVLLSYVSERHPAMC